MWLSIHCNRIFALKKMYFRVSIYKKRSQVGKSVNGLILIYLIYIVGFSGSSQVKSLSANTGDLGLIPGSKKCPGEGNGNPLQYSCLRKSHGQRSLEGYSPQGGKKSDTTFDMTEQQQDPKTRKEEMGVFHPPWGKPFPRARRLRIPAL